MVFFLEIPENGVIKNEEFFVYIDCFVLDLKIQIERSAIMDVCILLNGFVPIYGRAPAVIYLADLGKQIAVIGKEIHKPNGSAQEISVLGGIVRCQVIKIAKGFVIFFFVAALTIPGHRPKQPKTQHRA